MEQILYIGISQSFFAGLLIATKRPRIMANQVLAAWMFLICIEMIIVLLNSNLVQLYSIKVLPFTYGPLMYLYAKMMTVEKVTFSWKYLWHFAPFLVFFTLALVFLNKPVMEGTKGFLIIDRFISLRIIYGVSFFISITSYSVATYVRIHRHQDAMKFYLSYSSSKVTLRWLIGLSVTFYLSYILVFIIGLMDILMNFMPFDPYELSFLGLTIFAFLYGFFGFKQPSIFEEIVDKPHAIKKEEPAKPRRYMKSGLKEKDVERYLQKILQFMEKEKPYLDRELNITDVSNTLNIPRHFITEIINNHLGKNFYYFINEYRIEEVKQRLVDPDFRHLTILAIAYDSGFNSKSAFNSIFKDLAGMTPSQYVQKERG